MRTHTLHPRQLLSLIAFSAALLVHAQEITVAWAKQWSKPGVQQSAYDIAVDKAGNVYTTGLFNTTMDMDPGAGVANLTSYGSWDAYVVKLDVLGRFVWARQFGGTGDDRGNSVGVDLAGNVFCSGIISATADMDPGPGTFNLTNDGGPGNPEVFVVKLDANGNFLWAGKTGGACNILFSKPDMHTFVGGYTFHTGRFSGTRDMDPGPGTLMMTSQGVYDAYISLWKPDGSLVWAKQLRGSPGGGVTGTGICMDDHYRIYVTGEFSRTVAFDPGPAVANETPPGNDRETFVLKLLTDGSFQWVRRTTGGGCFGSAIAVDRSRNAVYYAGRYTLPTDFDPAPTSYNTLDPFATGNTAFVSALDLDGNFKWAKRAGGTSATASITEMDLDGSAIYVIGYMTGTIRFGPDGDAPNLVSAGSEDVFVASIGARTNQWAHAWRIGSANMDLGRCISAAMRYTLHIGGDFSNSVDFDPDADTYPLTATYMGSFAAKWATRCYTVSDLRVSRGFVMNSRMNLAWTPVNCVVDHYRLSYWKDNETTPTLLDLPANVVDRYSLVGELGTHSYFFHIIPIYPGAVVGDNSNLASISYTYPLVVGP